MLAERVYIGSRLDLEHYKGIAIQHHEFELLDINGDPFDVTIYANIFFDLYAKPHGKLLESTEIDEITSPNRLFLSQDAEVYERRPSLYFYEVRGYDDSSPAIPTLLYYGNFDLI